MHTTNNNYLIKEKLASCYIDFSKNNLNSSCVNTRIQVTNFFKNIMKEIDKLNIKEVSN